jgi:hypothetical protein
MSLRMKYAGVLTLFIAMVIIQGCYKAPAAQQAFADKKTILFTQVGMWTEKGHILATNYSRVTFIPVNSSVTISEITSNEIFFNYLDRLIYLKNVEKYTRINISELMNRTFAPEKVDLSKFSQTEKEAISHGKVILGMSKEAVIISRGYPPAHATFSLKSNSWRYWQNRFNTIIYQFIDNKVSKIIQ